MTVGDKAIEELAKLGQKGLETTDKAGGWIDRVFGEGFRHLAGAFEDSMAAFRIRNRLRIIEKTHKAIEAAGMSGETRALDPRISGPILEAISYESDETLQDVWAAYIKNAVTPQNPRPDRILVDIIRRLEPSDWPILRRTFHQLTGALTSADFGVADDELRQCLDRLEVLRLFDYDDPTIHFLAASKGDQKRLMVSIGDADYYATRLLRRLAETTKDQWNEE